MKIIVYVLDSLRADHLSCYGYNRNTSPEIDKLAKEGFIFENAFSVSTWTRSTAASILTSVYPSVHGVMTHNDFMPDGLLTLPELLRKKEVVTIGITAMGNISSVYGFKKGFTKYHDLFRNENLKGIRQKVKKGTFFGNHENIEHMLCPLSEDINDVAISALKKYREKDLFMFLWSIDTHGPFSHPSQYTKFVDPNYKNKLNAKSNNPLKDANALRHLINLYDSEIYHNDQSIGQLVKWLKELGLYEETTIFVMGDHGEGLGDHGAVSHGGPPYDSLMKIPLIIKLGHPFLSEQTNGTKVDNLVQLIDIFPTIAEMTNCSLDQVAFIQGRSLFPLLQKDKDRYLGHKAVYAEECKRNFSPHYMAIRTIEWKFIYCDYPFFKFAHRKPKKLMSEILNQIRWLRAGSKLLFNLKNDHFETRNLKKDKPRMAKEFMRQLINWQRDNKQHKRRFTKGLTQVKKKAVDDKLKKHLETLGYLD